MNSPQRRTNYRRLGSDFKAGVQGTFHLARALPRFFRERVTVEQAKEEIKRLLESREEEFLELVRSRIYGNSRSPYLKLLRLAGCEFSDLQEQVRRDGLGRTLEELAREGVYLTSDEFKGKKDVVRGRESFRVSASGFEHPNSAPGFLIQDSGASNRPVRSLVSLDWLRSRTFAMGVFFSAHDLFRYRLAVYDAILPGAGGVNNLLVYARLGISTERWFARKIPGNSWSAARYHDFTTYLIALAGKCFGPGFPKPEFIDIRDVHRIVRWVLEKNRQGNACCVRTGASNAVRIARAALDMGVSLKGTKFVVSGEPFTEAKRGVIEGAGASAIPQYGSYETGGVGYGCGHGLYIDEVHANEHMLALVTHSRAFSGDGTAIQPLLVTTLHPSIPRLLLNVEVGDYATLDRRHCGCALEKAGLTLHVHHIRSYEKFTSEGMNYFYGDLYEFFEKTLPVEFGGGPGDYQLVEDEDENGQTRLTLVIRPEVGKVDEAKILSRLQERLAEGSSANRFQAEVWRAAGTLRVKRAAPHASARGKILPLHISR